MPREDKIRRTVGKSLTARVLMKCAWVAVAALCVWPAYGRDVRLDWTAVVERPATGSMSVEPLSWRADSAMAMKVRYGASATTPAAMYTARVAAPVKTKHRLEAYVNITRVEAAATLRFTDAERKEIASVSVSTAAGSDGALVPGIWTPVAVEADLSKLTETHDLSAIYVDILPQWDGGKAVASDAAPLIMVEDAWLDVQHHGSNLSFETISNYKLDKWNPAGTSDTYLPGWRAILAEPEVGAHLTDFGAKLADGGKVQAEFISLKRPASGLDPFDHLAFKALAEPGTTITALFEDAKHDKNKDTRTVTVENGVWSEYRVPVTYPWSSVTLSADKPFTLDDCRLINTYENDMTADKLYVTSSADSGEGSLRQVIADAPDFSTISFLVKDVYLESSIELGSKSLTLGEYTDVNIHCPAKAPAFEVRPSKKNSLLNLRHITFYGSENNAPTNGGAISVPDSRGAVASTLILSGVEFVGTTATSNGGAIYLNDPSVTTTVEACQFEGCQAANGAAIAFNKGTALDVHWSTFTDCTSTGSTGGAVSITADGSARADIYWSEFQGCKSTAATGGAGGLAYQSLTAKAAVVRTLFDGCAGGRGAAISAYNNSRGTLSGNLDLIHCTAVNSAAGSPAVSIAASGSYQAPKTVLVNSIVALNKDVDLVAPATLESTRNIVGNTTATLNNSLRDVDLSTVFGYYDEDGNPRRESDKYFPIRFRGPAYDAAATTFVTSDGRELIDDKSHPLLFCWETWEMLSRGDHKIRSIGHTERYDYDLGVEDIMGNEAANDIPVSIYPNPATTTLNVRGDFDRMWISSMSGATVYVGTASTANVAPLAPGEYVASFRVGASVYSIKFIKK